MLKKRPFKRRKHLYEGLSQLLEMPQESLSSVPIFHMCGDNEMEITGCDGILEYTDEKIVLSAGKDKFTVTGNCLMLSDFRDKVLYVKGNIKSASFGCGEE